MGDSRILEIVSDLRLLCAEGEALLEAHSVRNIIGDEKLGSDPYSGTFHMLLHLTLVDKEKCLSA